MTQGMPFSAPTAPPWAPVVGMAGEAGALVLAVPEGMAGTVVVPAPILISMWPASMAGLAVAVAPEAGCWALAATTATKKRMTKLSLLNTAVRDDFI